MAQRAIGLRVERSSGGTAPTTAAVRRQQEPRAREHECRNEEQ